MAGRTRTLEPPVIAGQTAELANLSIAGEKFRLCRLPDMDRLLDQIDPAEFARDERMPYWAEPWLAGLIAKRADLGGRALLELGCGLGLPSIVTARKGARVTASDYFPEALALLEVNTALNGVRLRTRLFDWRTEQDIGQYDFVVAADVLYEAWQVAAVVDLLRRTVSAEGPGGRRRPRSGHRERIRQQGNLGGLT